MIPKTFFIITLVMGCCLLTESAPAQSQYVADPFLAVAVKITAPVNVLRANLDKAVPLKRDDRLYPGDRIICGEGGFASLIFADTAVELKLLPNTELTFQGQRSREGVVKRVMLHLGDMLTRVLHGEMEVVTPTCIASVKGTQWWTRVDQATQRTTVIVLEGNVRVASRATSEVQIVAAGSTSVVDAVGHIQVNPTTPEDLPKEAPSSDQGSLDIEFQDGSGQPKTLHIQFDR